MPKSTAKTARRDAFPDAEMLEPSPFELYDAWRAVSAELDTLGALEGPREAAGVDAALDTQLAIVERLAALKAGTVRDILIKMRIWAEFAAEVAPDCRDREPSDILAYSAFRDLQALFEGEQHSKVG